MICETWRDIKEYENLYQISSIGNVKTLHRSKEKLLKQRLDKNGYLRVGLYKNGKIKHYFVHDLVAEAFLDKKDFKYADEQDKINNLDLKRLQVNHINEFEKFNNNVENLEWCTRKYNINFGTSIQRSVNTRTKNGVYKKIGKINQDNLSKKVYQYNAKGELVKIWDSISQCTKDGYNNIESCCVNKRYTAYGYVWSYENLNKESVVEKFKKRRMGKTKPIYQYAKDGTFIKKWESSIDIKEETNFNFNAILNCCNGYSKTSNGFIWSYILIK